MKRQESDMKVKDVLEIPNLDEASDIDAELGGELKHGVFPEWRSIQTPMTPYEYAIPAYMFLLSSIMGSKLYFRIGHTKHAANLWYLFIGNSTRSKKSTVIDLVNEITEYCDIRYFGLGGSVEGLRNEMSKERNIGSGGDRRGAKGNIIESEMGEFLASLSREHMKKATYWLCKLHDFPRAERRVSLANQIWTLPNDYYITLLGGVQRTTLSQHARSEHMASGFYPRIIKVRGMPTGETRMPPPVSDDVLVRLKDGFKKLQDFKQYLKEDERLEFCFYGEESGELFEIFNEWGAAFDAIDPTFERLRLNAPRYAILKMASEFQLKDILKADNRRISPEAMMWGIRRALVDMTNQSWFGLLGISSGDKDADHAINMLEVILAEPGIDRTDLSRRYQLVNKWKRKDILSYLEHEVRYVRREEEKSQTNSKVRFYPTQDALMIFGEQRQGRQDLSLVLQHRKKVEKLNEAGEQMKEVRKPSGSKTSTTPEKVDVHDIPLYEREAIMKIRTKEALVDRLALMLRRLEGKESSKNVLGLVQDIRQVAETSNIRLTQEECEKVLPMLLAFEKSLLMLQSAPPDVPNASQPSTAL